MSDTLICNYCSGEIDLNGIICPHCEELCYFAESNAWIACSEKYPENNFEVLAYFPAVANIAPEIAVVYREGKDWLVRNSVCFREPTHWHSLPQPPVTRKDGE